MLKKMLIFLFLISVVGAILWYMNKQDKDPELLATVGNRQIRIPQFKNEVNRRGGRHLDKFDKRALLDKMILNEAILFNIFETGLDKDPEVIRTYHNLLIGKYKQRNLKPLIDNIKVSNEEIKEYYKNNIKKYTRPARARLAILYMKTHETMSQKKLDFIHNRMKEARKLSTQPVRGRGFGHLSIQYSEDQVTRYKGGDIGWVYEGRNYRWDKKIIDAGFNLENIGDVSKIISTDKGIYLVKLLDRRKSETDPIEKITAKIRHKLLLTKRKQKEESFLENIKNSTNVEIYDNVLESIVLPKTKKKKSKIPNLPK